MKKVILITSDKMGEGEEEICKIMIKKFFNNLVGAEKKPEAIIFYGVGVKLTIKGSPVLDALYTLENEGVKMLSCATCINYYGLNDLVEVGEITNMPEFLKIIFDADDTVTI